MYDLSGLAYRMWSSLSLFAAGVVLLLLCRRDPRKKHQRGTLILGIGAMILSVLFCGFYWLKVQNPQISSFDGTFCDSHSVSHSHSLKHRFTFLPFPSHPDDREKYFYLDVRSKKEIFPDELVEGELYRIYYEETCNVIVRIDVLASPEE